MQVTVWVNPALAPFTPSTVTTYWKQQLLPATCWTAKLKQRGTCANHSTCLPNTSWRILPLRAKQPSTKLLPWCAVVRHSQTWTIPSSPAFSTCYRVVTPAKSFLNFARALCGIASPERFAHAMVRNGWLLPMAAPFPTADSSVCFFPTEHEWASLMKKWCTSRDPAKRSCWVPARGALKTSRSNE